MRKTITNNIINKKFKALLTTVIGVSILLLLPSTAYAHAGAAPYHGFGTTNGRTDTVNVNDYHTNSWDRFSFNYQFHSGGNFRYELGKPTTFNGHVQLDVYSANIRRDKNVAFTPPSYGVFSGNVATQPTNLLFTQSVNPMFWNTFPQADPNVIPAFDTLQRGVNNAGQVGFLPSTSIGVGIQND